jgi:hypothetical protein
MKELNFFFKFIDFFKYLEKFRFPLPHSANSAFLGIPLSAFRVPHFEIHSVPSLQDMMVGW